MNRSSALRRRGTRLAATTAVVVAASLSVVGAAAAAPQSGGGPARGGVGATALFQVTNGSDVDPPAAGSYRAAIDAANLEMPGEPVTIDFDPGLTVTLDFDGVGYTNTGPLTLNGNGATIDGVGAFQLLDAVNAASVTVDDLTMQNGSATPGLSGGAIQTTTGNVTITGSTFSGNAADADGGAIGTSSGDVMVSDSTFSGNSAGAAGGAIETSSGDITAVDSSFTGNTAGTDGGAARMSVGGTGVITDSMFSANTATAGSGGGLYTDNGAHTVTNSTFNGNTAAVDGGGARASTGDFTISNSTFSQNTADGGGGLRTDGDVTLVYATVVDNTAGSFGASVAANMLTSIGSVVAGPFGVAANCDVFATVSHGWNFSDDANAATSCMFDDATDLVGPANDPALGALADNGGPTLTRLPQTGSPLINAIPVGSCHANGAGAITTDQRGTNRPQGTGCDIGAVDVPGPPAPPTTVPPPTTLPQSSTLPVCPATSQSSITGGALLGAEGVVASVPLGIAALWRRRRRQHAAVTSRSRITSVLTSVMVAGIGIAVLGACAPLKPPPPGC